MNEQQRLVVEEYPAPHMFSIISWGCAATGWIARTLTSHPEVLCVHALNSTWAIFSGQPPLCGVDYMRALGVLGTGNAAAGDIHGIRRGEVPALKAAFPGLGLAVVVREPAARLRSVLALWERHNWRGMSASQGAIGAIAAEGRDPAELSHRELLEVTAALHLDEIVEEIKLGPIFRSEDITKDPDALRSLVAAVANVDSDRAWAEAAVVRPAQNQHQRHGSPIEARVRDLIDRYVSADAVRHYRSLGYSVGDA